MSLPLSTEVALTVNLQNPGLPREGFGVPALLSNTGNAWSTSELTRSYTKTSYSGDFPVGTVENAALEAFFAQDAPPAVAVVIKGANKPTMVKTILIVTATDKAVYTIKVWCKGTLWSSSFTSSSSTAIQIAAGLVALLSPTAWVAGNAYTAGQRATNDTGKIYEVTIGGTSDLYGSGPTGTGSVIVDGTVTWKYVVTPNFTAANGGTATVTLTGSAAGNWFAAEPIALAAVDAVSDAMTLTDTTTDPAGHVSADLTAAFAVDKSWYGLGLLFKSDAIVNTGGTGVGPWCAANGRLLVVSFADTVTATTTDVGASDVGHDLKAAGSHYSAGQWHPRDYEFLDLCTLGYFLPIPAGQDNWRLKPLTGPTPVNFTTSQAGIDTAYLDVRRLGYFSTLGNQNVLAGKGYVMSTTYGFIDVTHDLDWYASNLQIDLVDLLLKNNKLPNTNAGRRIIANAIASRNLIGIQMGVISPDPLDPLNSQTPITEPFTVTMPDVSDPSSFDPVTRQLSGVSTTWKYNAPIDSMVVTVNVQQ